IAFRVARGQPALVPPPERDSAPVEGGATLGAADRGEHLSTDRPAGENDMRDGLFLEDAADRLVEPRRDRRGEGGPVVVDQDDTLTAHAALPSSKGMGEAVGAVRPVSPCCRTSPKRSSGSSLRSSSARQSRRVLRGSEMSWTGWPGWTSVTM